MKKGSCKKIYSNRTLAVDDSTNCYCCFVHWQRLRLSWDCCETTKWQLRWHTSDQHMSQSCLSTFEWSRRRVGEPPCFSCLSTPIWVASTSRLVCGLLRDASATIRVARDHGRTWWSKWIDPDSSRPRSRASRTRSCRCASRPLVSWLFDTLDRSDRLCSLSRRVWIGRRGNVSGNRPTMDCRTNSEQRNHRHRILLSPTNRLEKNILDIIQKKTLLVYL